MSGSKIYIAISAMRLNILQKFSLPCKASQRGIAIYLAAVTLSIIMAVALGVSLMSIYQLKSLNEAGSSVIAFAAAETGIEWALINVTSPGYDSGLVSLGDATYQVTSFLCGAANDLCIRSVGNYHGTQRAIRVRQ